MNTQNNQIFNSEKEFYKALEQTNSKFLKKSWYFEFNRIEFNFELSIPFQPIVGNTSDFLTDAFRNGEYVFNNCLFNSGVDISYSKTDITFENNCDFKAELSVYRRITNLTFKNSKINYLNLSEAEFGKEAHGYGKLRIKKCLVKKSNFKNATFYSLVDFYQTTFEETVIFNKTDFLNVLVLSATKFEKNMLFTYTLLNDKVIMRGTKFFKGFDISLAIIKGELALFDIKLDHKKYIAEESELSEEDYEDFVANKGRIPISNKRETYRVLKKEFISNADYIHSLKYKRSELETYDKILVNNINQNFDKWKSRFNWHHWSSFWNIRFLCNYTTAFFPYKIIKNLRTKRLLFFLQLKNALSPKI